MSDSPKAPQFSPTKRKASPEEPNTKDLDFPEAIREIIKGKRVTKREWGNEQYWFEMRNVHLQIHKPDGNYHDLIVSEGDMIGDDYRVLNGEVIDTQLKEPISTETH